MNKCRSGRHVIKSAADRDVGGGCKPCRRERQRKYRKKVHDAYKEKIEPFFSVPQSVFIDESRPDVDRRRARIEKAIKLAHKAARAGEKRTAWNYVVFAEATGRGIFVPTHEQTKAVFGHEL